LKVGADSLWDSLRLTVESARYLLLSLPGPGISIPAFVVSVAESKTERKCFLRMGGDSLFKPARAAMPVALPHRDYRRPAAVAPGKARLLRAFRDSGVAWNCGDPLKSFAFGR
jgi:hypothetical protein